MKKTIFSIMIISLVLMSCSLTTANRTLTPGANGTPAATLTAAEQAVGPARITGTFTYSNDIIEDYYVEQSVALLDMTGFIFKG